MTIVVEDEAFDKKGYKYTDKNYISCVAFGDIAKKIFSEVKEDDDIMVRARIVNSSYEDKTTKIKKYSDNTSSVGTGDDLAPIIVISAYVDSNLAKKMITLNLFDSKLNEKLKEIFNS